MKIRFVFVILMLLVMTACSSLTNSEEAQLITEVVNEDISPALEATASVPSLNVVVKESDDFKFSKELKMSH